MPPAPKGSGTPPLASPPPPHFHSRLSPVAWSCGQALWVGILVLLLASCDSERVTLSS